MGKRVLAASLLLLLLGLAVSLAVLPRYVDARFNRIVGSDLPAVSEQARRLHERLFVADLHADPLLWARDLNRRSDYGHVDVPRLIEGNVALQTFAAVTQSPSGQNYDGNTGDTDRLTALMIAQRWPVRTWTSLKERALYQARKLHTFSDRSEGRLTVIHSRRELDAYVARRAGTRDLTAGLLSVEGLHALEGDLENVDAFFEAGYRMMAITHFFDNALGGSLHGVDQGGLTPFGREVIQRMQTLGIIIDLAHVSEASMDDILDMSSGPVVVSHTGVQGTCPGPRNLTDRHVRRVAERGGVIGIGYWSAAVCGTDPTDIVRAIRYVTNLVGVEAVGLGSDFDGTVLTRFDTTGLVHITDALLADGFSKDDIAKIMGGNVLRVYRETLPPI